MWLLQHSCVMAELPRSLCSVCRLLSTKLIGWETHGGLGKGEADCSAHICGVFTTKDVRVEIPWAWSPENVG